MRKPSCILSSITTLALVILAILTPVVSAQVRIPGPGGLINTGGGLITAGAAIAQNGTINGVTTSSINTSGATLIIVLTSSYAVASADAVSDSEMNMWTALTPTSTGTSSKATLWYCVNPATSTMHTFTDTLTGGFPAILVQAFNNGSVFDQEAAGSSSSGTTSQPGSITPSENNAVVVTGIGLEDTIGIAIDSGYTISATATGSAGNSFAGSLAYKIQTTATATNPTWSWTNNQPKSNVAASFKKVP